MSQPPHHEIVEDKDHHRIEIIPLKEKQRSTTLVTLILVGFWLTLAVVLGGMWFFGTKFFDSVEKLESPFESFDLKHNERKSKGQGI